MIVDENYLSGEHVYHCEIIYWSNYNKKKIIVTGKNMKHCIGQFRAIEGKAKIIKINRIPNEIYDEFYS